MSPRWLILSLTIIKCLAGEPSNVSPWFRFTGLGLPGKRSRKINHIDTYPNWIHVLHRKLYILQISLALTSKIVWWGNGSMELSVRLFTGNMFPGWFSSRHAQFTANSKWCIHEAGFKIFLDCFTLKEVLNQCLESSLQKLLFDSQKLCVLTPISPWNWPFFRSQRTLTIISWMDPTADGGP